MQSLLTNVIEITTIASLAYFVLMFAVGCARARSPIDLSEFALSDAELAELQQAAPEPVEDAIDEETIGELCAISASVQPICYETLTVHAMRTLGSLYEIPGARRWNRSQALNYWRQAAA